MESSSFSGSSKRAKALANIAQVAHCLVDGCTADLSLCRDYHRRHKVCEAHSKTPKVSIGGREQRFCQQCSRFHSLIEFDEGKRSCRKRLDGHNRRRRKPQPESLIPQRSSSSSAAAGTRLVSFNAPQIVGGSGVVGYPWSGVVKTENEIGSAMQQQQQQQQQFNYMETCSSPHFGYVDPNAAVAAAAAAAAGSHKMMFSDMVDSGGALSLLSSGTLNSVPPSMDYAHYHQSKLDVPSTSSTLHFPHHAPEGSSHQTLSFMWE